MATVTALRRFNTGIVKPISLGRTDFDALLGAAEEMENWLPLPNGAMRVRPGFERREEGAATSRLRTFIYEIDDSTQDTAILDFRASAMKVLVDGSHLSRPTQYFSITNGDFSSSIATGWTATTSGGTTAVTSGGNLVMTATSNAKPTVVQSITPTDGSYHAAKIVVSRGPVLFRVGSSSGDDDVFGESYLDTGEHHLQWPDVATNQAFYVQFSCDTPNVQRIVDSIEVASSGDLSVTTPWGGSDLDYIRFEQVGDIMFCGRPTYQQRKIERRANDSWSVVKYYADDGPFISQTEHSATLSASATSGNITLTAGSSTFRDSHVGALFQLQHNTQTRTDTFNAVDQDGDTIKITGGSTDDRTIDVTIDKTTGSFNGTIVIERAFGDPVSYTTWQTYAGTSDVSATIDETNDDRIVYVRATCTAYTTGSATVTLFTAQGETLGVVRVTAVASATSASAEVLAEIGSTDATSLWREGEWSDYRGWPSVPCIHQSRMFWFSGVTMWGSSSDNFYSFDEEIEGDSAPIYRQLGGQVSNVKWAVSMGRKLLYGSSVHLATVEAGDYEVALTNTNAALVHVDDIGSTAVQAQRIDNVVFYMDRTGARPMGVGPGQSESGLVTGRFDFLTEGLLADGIKEIAVQRRPHTRVWFLTNSGEIYIFTYEPAEEVQAWSKISMRDATFSALTVEPTSDRSDRVWVVATRDSTVSIMRMFGEHEVGIGDLNKQLDDSVVYESLGSATMTGLDHIDGEYPGLWIDGAPVSPNATVVSGSYTHSATVTNAVAGRTYAARWLGAKLAYAAQGTSLMQKKQIYYAGLMLVDTCIDGTRFGMRNEDIEKPRPLPRIYREAEIPEKTLYSQLEYPLTAIDGGPDYDPRVILEQIAPYPAAVIGIGMGIDDRPPE